MDGCYYQCTQIRCFITLVIFIILEFYSHVIARRNVIHDIHDEGENEESDTHYQYQLSDGLSVEMGEKEKVKYVKNTPTCKIDETSLESIKVMTNETSQKWVEKQNRDVKLGAYYAPRHCCAANRVAVIVPYRDRRVHLGIFLRYMHPLLKKQLLEYRIFVIEQYGTERFNKGTLYNIAFLETQRFGTWGCLIFHDVNLVPQDERISYSCPKHPTNMAAAVESYGYVHILLMLSKIRRRKEGLTTTKYKLLRVTEIKLYTHILADVNPAKMKVDMKSVMQSVVRLHGEALVLGRNEFILSQALVN